MMPPQLVTYDERNGYSTGLAELAQALVDGALIIFPTETVYGVAANAARVEATQRLRRLKGNLGDRPFTVHIARRQQAAWYVTHPSPVARRLSRKLWPGPLTLICEQADPTEAEIAQRCPAELLQQIFSNGKVGLRCPNHPAAAALLTAAGGAPIVASSANRAGNPPPQDLQGALRELDGDVDYAVDGGPTRSGVASSIVEVHGNEWSIRRTGSVDARTIARLARSEILFVCTGNSCRSPMAQHMFCHMLRERLGMTVAELEAAGYVCVSAGTFAGGGTAMSDGTATELARRGIDPGLHRSQPLTIELIQRAERIYCMSEEHRSTVLQLAPSAEPRVELLDPSHPVPDPVGGDAEAYRVCAEQIERALEARLREFLDEDRDW
jgi:tRNA threonylcarbamoyl adenosine modification protein (Sua5/YciO/YrdC/YwlC family)